MEGRSLVPELRFGSFQGNWNYEFLGDVCSKIGSGSTPRGGDSVYQKTGIPFIRSQNVINNRLQIDETHISKEVHLKMKGSKVVANDVLLNITGGSIGRTCVVPSGFDEGNVNQHVAIIRPTKYDPNFIQFILSSDIGQKLIFQGQTGSGREGLNFQSIRKFKIGFPPLPEQQKIASFLTSVDKRIQLLQTKKEKLEEYKKGVMQKLFPSKDGQAPEIRFKITNEAGELVEPPDWEEKKLGEIASFLKGKGISKVEIDENGNLQCIRYGQLYTTYSEVIIEVVSKTNVTVDKLVLSHANDVIIPASGETVIDIATAACVVNSGIALGGDLNIIRSKANGVFLSYYLNNARKFDIARLAQGISVVHLYSSQLKTLRINLPVSQEQQKIANFLSSIDESIEKVNQQIEGSKEFKKGLLQKMFV